MSWYYGFIRAMPPHYRASLIRHFAIGGAALTAYLLREDLRVDNRVLWIFVFAILLNLGTTLVPERPRWAIVARICSPLFGIGGWTALALMTGGVASPFLAGFGLEIILSGLTFSPLGTVLVTAGTIAGIWSQESLLGLHSSIRLLTLQTSFLAATGALTFYVARHWARSQEDFSRRAAALRRRLELLEKELADARCLGQIGEGAARLAHGLKNAVHSLRGFARLIEPRLLAGERDVQALDGLRSGIDHLEEIARAVLHPFAAVASEWNSGAVETDLRRAIQEVVEEVGRRHPGVRWASSSMDTPPTVPLPPSLLREILFLLVQNAAEAVGDSGEVRVAARLEEGVLRIDIRDNGPGLPATLQEDLFRPGYTTKPSGSGFGLFLARRLVEKRGGILTAETAPAGGAQFSVQFPLRGPQRYEF